MKRSMFFVIMILLSSIMTSCISAAVATEVADDPIYEVNVSDDTIVKEVNNRIYYSYYTDNYYIGSIPVILIDGIYYYQYWDISLRMWWRERVPYEYLHHVHACVRHNRYLGGRWVRHPYRYHHPDIHHNRLHNNTVRHHHTPHKPSIQHNNHQHSPQRTTPHTPSRNHQMSQPQHTPHNRPQQHTPHNRPQHNNSGTRSNNGNSHRGGRR